VIDVLLGVAIGLIGYPLLRWNYRFWTDGLVARRRRVV